MHSPVATGILGPSIMQLDGDISSIGAPPTLFLRLGRWRNPRRAIEDLHRPLRQNSGRLPQQPVGLGQRHTPLPTACDTVL